MQEDKPSGEQSGSAHQVSGWVNPRDLKRLLQDIADLIDYRWDPQELSEYVSQVGESFIVDEDKHRLFHLSGSQLVEIACLHDGTDVQVYVTAPENLAQRLHGLLTGYRPRNL